MKLLDILNKTNTIEKTAFFKTISTLIENEDNTEEIDEILNDNRQIKELEYERIAKVFNLLKNSFQAELKEELANNLSQLDIFIDILIRDGNNILDSIWFEEIYKREIQQLSNSSKEFIELIINESKELDSNRLRDYNIYRKCVSTAYKNDTSNNIDNKVTTDEYSILQTLAEELELSNEEIRLINFSIVPLQPLSLENIIKELKDLSIIFYHKKDLKLYVPDEIVKILRELRGKSVADKYLRRVLKKLKGPQINSICKKHNINQRIGFEEKVKSIINQGVSIRSILKNGIHKEDTNMNDRKKVVNDLMESLNIDSKGITIDDKIDYIIEHFNKHEKDETIGISVEGYEKLCTDIALYLPEFNTFLRKEFEFREEKILNSTFLIDHNLKPRDILDLMTNSQIRDFCGALKISTRGDEIQNILDSYTDAESVYIENYINIGNRDLAALKANNINLTTAEIGSKFEEVTKLLLKDLGFEVDEDLRKETNSKKDQVDIIIRTSKDEVIIVECKTAKSQKFDKFSSCSRQIKSYQKHLQNNGFRVIKSLLVAPNFSEDFIEACDLDIELNLSLITSDVLFNIWSGFKKAKHQVFPVNLLMRDALINDDKILKALKVK
ncbi:MAG: hypothetical protein R3277_10255 [Brumimicrobium sp.]|nr:hypothetical protein [Brumimicrobium sp.]